MRRKAAREYKVDDYVKIRNVEAINKKLLPKFKGPYVIKKVLDDDCYVVTDLDGFQLIPQSYTVLYHLTKCDFIFTVNLIYYFVV